MIFDNLIRFFQFQLAQTCSKQEEDISSPFKHHDDVEAREELVQKLKQ
jgi:hypothetical protein